MSLEDEVINLTGAVESIDSREVASAIRDGFEEVASAIREGFEKLVAAGAVDSFESMRAFDRTIEHIEVGDGG
jgi:hypothetical protein